MKVRVLRSALDDLSDGRRFYDQRVQGIGSYFFDSLFSEIDSLSLFGGVHRVQFGFHRLLAKRLCSACWIAAATRTGFKMQCEKQTRK